MNREQRRALESKLMREHHTSRANAKKVIYLAELRDKENAPDIPDGTAVKINAARILSNHGNKLTNYLTYVKEHRNEVFHVSRDDPKANKTMVVFAEDQTPVKWMWHTSDLIVVKEETDV